LRGPRQPFVVENKAGAGGTIAARRAREIARRRLRVMMMSQALAYSASLYPDLPYGHPARPGTD